MTLTEFIQIIMGFIGSLGFAILFNIRGKRLLFASLGGLLSWLLFVLLGNFLADEALRYFIVAMIISAYAEVMARILKTPTTTFIATSIIPLVPGSALYYTMAHAFEGDAENFIAKAIYTLQLSCALALGVVVVTAFTRLVYRLKEKRGHH
ncbi:MAG: threonine/serine exporter family protein [Clostridia bacterium]|nr:threonine/serine exporter family protein [Clostridia bacterium]